MATVNLTPTPEIDGVPYCTAVPLTSTEADLGDSVNTPAPIGITYGQIIVAVVQLTITGNIVANSALVVMQTDMGDGVWVDAAWVFFNQGNGSATYVMCGGVIGSSSNVFQQTRNSGAMPATQASGSNAVPLAGRVRFTGFARFAGGSSSVSGTTTAVKATIKYKLLTPR